MRGLRVAALVLLAAAAAALPATTGRAGEREGPLDRFVCYPAQFGPSASQRLALVDRIRPPFATTIVLPETVCSPAGPGGARFSTAFLTCYRAARTTRLRAPLPRSVRTVDALTAATLRLGNTARVCLASARIDADGPARPSRLVRLLTCYEATPAAPVVRTGVTVVDVFGESDETLRGPDGLCVPAARAGRLPLTRPYLACYAVDSATKGPTVVLRNELGYVKAALGPRSSVCLAAIVSR